MFFLENWRLKMSKTIDECKRYITDILSSNPKLRDYIEESTILLNTYECDTVWDLMVLIEDNWFLYEFSHLYGEHFVLDDHKHDPPVFTRIKSYGWLTENFSKRLPVALWIFQNSIIIQEKEALFRRIISEQGNRLSQSIQDIIKRKYLELRGDRHNLRYSINRPDDMANALLKANIVKLCLELSLLANGKSYPFRALLPDHAKNDSVNGQKTFFLTQKFLAATDEKTVISLSDDLIEHVINVLRETGLYANDFLLRWWLYID
jgi:hypothetical protein